MFRWVDGVPTRERARRLGERPCAGVPGRSVGLAVLECRPDRWVRLVRSSLKGQARVVLVLGRSAAGWMAGQSGW